MRKLIFLSGLIVISSSIAKAQQRELTELSQLIKASFTHHPKFMEAEASMQIANERLKLTSMNTRPDLNADFNYAYVMPRIELPINGQKVQFAPVNSVNTYISSSYTILDFGRQKSALDRARNELTTTQHNKDVMAFGLAYQVASIYYQMLYLRRAISVQDTTIGVLREARRIAHVQFQQGSALAIDSMSLESNLLLEENRKIELQTLLRKQEVLLEYATGQILSNDPRTMPAIPTSYLDTTHPEIIVLSDKWNQAKLEAEATRLKSRPLMMLRGMAGTRNGYVPSVNDLRFNYSAGIGFSVPLYSAGKIKQQVRVQDRIAERQEIILKTAQVEMAKDQQLAEEEFRSTKTRLSNLSQQIALSEAVLQVALSKYRNGTGLYLEIISASGSFQKALLGLLQGQFQVGMAELELARVKGIRFWN